MLRRASVSPSRCLVTLALLLTATRPAVASMLVGPPSLDQLTREAATIVHATVDAVGSGRDEAGRPATWVTLRVHRGVKGRRAGALVFKQFGVAAPLADGTVLRISGVPRWTTGEEVVLFLRGESPAGFTSPVGLADGVLAVERGAGSPRVARRGGGDREALDSFLAEVERLGRMP